MMNKLSIMINVGSYEGSLLGFEGDLKHLENQYAFSASLGSILCAYRVSRYLLIGGYEEIIKIYDVKKKREVGVLDSHSGTVTSITGHQNFIFTGSEDGTIKVWKTKDWALLQTLDNIDAPIVDISVHSSGRLMVSATRDSRIQVWNLLTMKNIYQRRYQVKIQKIRFLENGNDEAPMLLIMSSNQVCLVDTETNKICNSMNFKASLTDIAIHGSMVIVSDQSGMINIINLDKTSKKLIMTFQAHSNRVKQMSILKTQDLVLLCSISTNGEIKIWDFLTFLTDEVEDTIELQDKVKPINMIKTQCRLTCLCVHELSNEYKEEIENITGKAVVVVQEEKKEVQAVKTQKKIKKVQAVVKVGKVDNKQIEKKVNKKKPQKKNKKQIA